MRAGRKPRPDARNCHAVVSFWSRQVRILGFFIDMEVNVPGLSIPHAAWILVGDGEKALVFRNEGDEEYPDLRTVEVFAQENPLTHEQGADRPGRFPDNTGPMNSGARSAVEQTDWHQLAKTRFAKDVADHLYRAAHAGRFDKLVAVAPPHVLGDLRKHWHDEVASRIIGEVDKTLTNHPVPKIEKILTSKG
jgi:protein required for attachment to host cells